MVAGLLAILGASVLCTYAVRRLALRFRIIDTPGDARKIHRVPTPLLGGVAVIAAFSSGVFLFWDTLIGGYLLPKHLIGVLIAAGIIGIGGALDDRYNLRPHLQILFPVLAACVIITSGIGIQYVTNPFGGTFDLNAMNIQLFTLNGLPYHITLFADLFTLVWLMGMMYTTKFLDGLDGLVSGITIIGLLVIYWLSMSQEVFQPETALLALIAAFAFLGFLLFNWNPASIFLGESGSVFAGFILGILAIISGGKIATALLILGIPILDVLWVIARRLLYEKRSPFQADRKHLHLRLVDMGLTHKQVVLLLYSCTALFGAAAITLQSKEKIYAFLGVVAVMILLSMVVVRARYRKKQ